ncbi:DUF3090 domain-containing protein [Rhabdothermincola sp.]|uniref:DUF3090 domain-containing protein n=1 Tax=Rhabdothermincola sp. TaxID=2820405 RepID=UPI002FE01CE2
MNASYDLHPDRFATGAIGEPGQRVFFLQAVEDDEVVTLRVEKQQVAALAEYLAGILADLPPAEPVAPTEADLVEPLTPAWTVGALAVAYDESSDRVLIVAEELVALDDDTGEPEEEPASARFHVTRAQVTGFIRRAVEVVRAGRPRCIICGRPMDPGGHVCPRSNGHSSR